VVTKEAIRAQLERILESRQFVRSQSLSKFLRYVVEETIADRGPGIKEYVLGIEVFGRGENFDPRIDPIVRVQAAKVRSRLEEYYKSEGSEDPLIIEMPKGAYVPAFQARDQPQPALARKKVKPLGWKLALIGGAVLSGIVILVLTRPRAVIRAEELQQITFDRLATFPTISPDGRFVAYAADRAGRGDLDLYVQQVVGGAPLRLTTNEASDITPDFSPDGTRIVFRSHRGKGGIYLIATLGGQEQHLVDEGWNPRFSPNGEWIVYQGTSSKPMGDLYTIPANGGSPRLISTGDDMAITGAASPAPDGKAIIFLANRTEKDGTKTPDWWVVSAQGGKPQPTGLLPSLRAATLDVRHGAWFENAFIFSVQRNNLSNLWMVEMTPGSWLPKGSPRQITFGSAKETNARVARNGTLVFVNEHLLTHIWGIPVDFASAKITGSLIQLTSDLSLEPGSSADPPVFALAAGRLAFASSRSGNPDVWVKDIKSQVETQITKNPWPEDKPLLSPDGKWLCFRNRQKTKSDLYVIDLTKSVAAQICEDCGTPSAWSSDGKTIVSVSESKQAVVSIDRESGRSELLVDMAALHPGGDLRVLQAELSPTAHLLGIVVNDHIGFLAPFPRGLRSMENWITVTKNNGVESMHFSPDGKRLFYFIRTGSGMNLMSMPLGPDGRPAGQEVLMQQFPATDRLPWTTWISVSDGYLAVRLTESSSVNIWKAQLTR